MVFASNRNNPKPRETDLFIADWLEQSDMPKKKKPGRSEKGEPSWHSAPQLVRRLAGLIMRIVSDIPESSYRKSKRPKERAQELVNAAALQSAALSGTLALPSGPLAVATVLPDLYGIWRRQAQLVADIAAVYGKKAHLRQEAMIYCLFNHVSSQLVNDLTVRLGERALVQHASLLAIEKTVVAIGGRVGQRAARRAVSRWVPVFGALGMAKYAYSDTSKVGRTAIKLFSRKIPVMLKRKSSKK